MYAGLVAIPVDDRAVKDSAPMLLKVTEAKAIWTEAGVADIATHNGCIRLQGDLSKQSSEVTPAAARTPSDLAALMATSGSTGVPRFVMVSHGNLIANTEAIIRSQRLGNNERAMLILPVSYCFGASVLHTHLYQGGSVVFDRRFMFPDKVLGAVAQFACTTFAGVPTVYNVLLRRSSIRKIAMPSLKRFLQAGGGLPLQRISEMRAAFPSIDFYVMYGQTEATARISCMEPERWEEKRGSVGKPLDNLTVLIVDEDGHVVPHGQVGELLAKGPSICGGYLNNPEETCRVYQDGWLHTGDLARRDEEGYIWIEGRKGSFLKMRGMRVSFPEVEAKVTAVPGVYECAARAVQHPEAGEALVLLVVTDEGVTVGAEEIRRYLPAHWAIDSIRFVSELPKTSVGKLALSALPL
jgi:acyl-CoA synthetase (AMP-forming)/AMP-acid ligase II